MKIDGTSKVLIKNTIILFFAGIVLGTIVLFIVNMSYILGYILGLTVGSLASVLRILILDFSARKVIDMDKKVAVSFFRKAYMFRLLVGFGFLALIFYLHPTVNLYAGILGLLNMSLAVYMYKILNRKGENKLNG
ncbi:MAG: hypothetical protein FWD82_02245 [Defluviitaleaceae bacterium]|nr:hypothetical protein [Defluviitaleaceae bacterium]